MAPAVAETELLVETREGVLILTLNRPQVLNSLTDAMLSSLLDALRGAERDPKVRAVVLAASGRAFCAGADLGRLAESYRPGTAPSLGAELTEKFNPLVLQLRRMEKPVIAAVNGVAAGAGASLALACDIRLCAPEAKFIAAFISVGLAPDSGITHLFAHRLGLGPALERCWTAEPITAEEALGFGLVNRVLPASELKAAALTLAGRIAKMPPRAVALTKRSFNRALDSSFEDHLGYEAQLQEVLGRTKDHLEGVRAFLERRTPVFTGE